MTETKRQLYSRLLASPLRSLKAIVGRAVASREQQLGTVIDNISQGVCMFDPSQRLVVCNARYLQMYNLSAEA
jgi:PAS domain-containing protein